jgi:hypothetical protein
MKARDIEAGTVIDGWTVTEVVFNARGHASRYSAVMLLDPPDDVFVLLTLEKLRLDYTLPTRRTWFRADEEVSL